MRGLDGFGIQMRAVPMAVVGTGSPQWVPLLQRCSPGSLPTPPVNHPLTPAPDAAVLEPRLPGVGSPVLMEEGCIGTAAEPGASALARPPARLSPPRAP